MSPFKMSPFRASWVIFPPAILGPEMAAPSLWEFFWFFLLENPHAHKIRKRRFVHKMFVHNFHATEPPPSQPTKWWIFYEKDLKQNCEHSAKIANKPSNTCEQTELWTNRFLKNIFFLGGGGWFFGGGGAVYEQNGVDLSFSCASPASIWGHCDFGAHKGVWQWHFSWNKGKRKMTDRLCFTPPPPVAWGVEVPILCLCTRKKGVITKRGQLAGGISKFSKFSRVSRKWSASLLFSTFLGLSRISKFSRISRDGHFEKTPFPKDPFSKRTPSQIPNGHGHFWRCKNLMCCKEGLFTSCTQGGLGIAPRGIINWGLLLNQRSSLWKSTERGESLKLNFWPPGSLQIQPRHLDCLPQVSGFRTGKIQYVKYLHNPIS